MIHALLNVQSPDLCDEPVYFMHTAVYPVSAHCHITIILEPGGFPKGLHAG